MSLASTWGFTDTILTNRSLPPTLQYLMQEKNTELLIAQQSTTPHDVCSCYVRDSLHVHPHTSLGSGRECIPPMLSEEPHPYLWLGSRRQTHHPMRDIWSEQGGEKNLGHLYTYCICIYIYSQVLPGSLKLLFINSWCSEVQNKRAR